ncbi:MAG TPA: DUF885 domain-containing protein [Acidimicrobiia bacterium]|nr:DUF885 domain-containing protein [Acidimicrobiia bacterium]
MSEARNIADDYWQLFQEKDQLTALWQGELEYLERWQDLSEEGVESYRTALLDIVDRAEAARVAATPEDAVTLSTVAWHARAAAASTEAMAELEVHNPVVGAYAAIAAFLPRYTLVTPDHGDRYLQKLHNLPVMLDQMVDALGRGRDRGWVPNELHVRMMIDVLDRALATDPAQDPLVGQPAPSEGGHPDWDQAVIDTVRDRVRPALRRYREALETVSLPVAPSVDTPGLCHLDGGEGLYRRLVRGFTTTDLTPEQVHERGLEQVARLDEEYRQLGGATFGTTELPEIYARLRDDESLHYHDVDTLIADATEMFRRAQAEAPKWFRRVPESDCEVRPTTAGAMAFYSGPNPDTGKPAAFYFNVTDPSLWGPQLASTTFHEGIPGHHFDLARSIENESLHLVQRKLYIAAFNEGWGLYSERLSEEMGLYRNDIERLGMLAADSLRACRLVVDTGMHLHGWSRDRAIRYMLDNSPLPRGEIEAEIDRYIGNPGQAVSYMIGRLEIDAARREAERALGSRFEIADFHESVLGHGTIPLETMRQLVEAWVASVP